MHKQFLYKHPSEKQQIARLWRIMLSVFLLGIVGVVSMSGVFFFFFSKEPEVVITTIPLERINTTKLETVRTYFDAKKTRLESLNTTQLPVDPSL